MRALLLVASLVLAAAAAACGATPDAPEEAPIAISRAPAPAVLAPCSDGDPAAERWGSTCICCHEEFGVAGSIAHGTTVARVILTAADGEVVTLAPNRFDNFFRHYPLALPLRAAVEGPDGRRVEMAPDAPTGDCNACHGTGGSVAPIHGP